jgi:hypothetical protein
MQLDDDDDQPSEQKSDRYFRSSRLQEAWRIQLLSLRSSYQSNLPSNLIRWDAAANEKNVKAS